MEEELFGRQLRRRSGHAAILEPETTCLIKRIGIYNFFATYAAFGWGWLFVSLSFGAPPSPLPWWTVAVETKMGPCLATERRKVFDNDKRNREKSKCKRRVSVIFCSKIMRTCELAYLLAPVPLFLRSSDSSAATGVLERV